MHPHKRVPFNAWIKKLYNRGFLSAETFKNRTTIYDAMPACCKRLTVEQHQLVMGTIWEVYRSSPSNEKVWTKQNILRLYKFVNLDDVLKLRGCFLTENIDPSVTILVEEYPGKSNTGTKYINSTGTTNTIDHFCSWKH